MALNTSPRLALRSRLQLLRPLLTSRSGSTPSPFRAQNEISPGKNALLPCTTAGSTPPRLDHESFSVIGPLALLGSAFYPVRVPRLAVSLHASSPHSVALVQLRFASFAVINLRRDSHPQECAHAGRTKKKRERITRSRSFSCEGQTKVRLRRRWSFPVLLGTRRSPYRPIRSLTKTAFQVPVLH